MVKDTSRRKASSQIGHQNCKVCSVSLFLIHSFSVYSLSSEEVLVNHLSSTFLLRKWTTACEAAVKIIKFDEGLGVLHPCVMSRFTPLRNQSIDVFHNDEKLLAIELHKNRESLMHCICVQPVSALWCHHSIDDRIQSMLCYDLWLQKESVFLK